MRDRSKLAGPPALRLAMLAVLTSASGAFAQLQFREIEKRHLPGDTDRSHGITVIDVDRDGRLDLFVANDGQSRLYRQVGPLLFADETQSRLPARTDVTMAAAAGDIDGDGDADLVLVAGDTTGARTRLYLNDGKGRFVDATQGRLPADADASRSVALTDVDADGDLDIVIANRPDFLGKNGQNRLYRNDGSAGFADVTATRLPQQRDASNAVSAGDVDGDGDIDLVFANDGKNTLWLGDGKGRFTDASAALPPAASDTHAVALGDIDNDTDLDIVFGNAPRASNGKWVGGQDVLLLGDGKGGFQDKTTRLPVESDHTNALVIVDVDNDNDADVVVTTGDVQRPGQNRVWINNGSGGFTDETKTRQRLAIRESESSAVVAADLDGDSDSDLVVANIAFVNELHVNDGGGVFVDASSLPLPTHIDDSFAIAAADFDGDGDVDLAFGNFFDNRVYLNDAHGSFADTGMPLPGGSRVTTALAAADLNRDAKVDLLAGNWGAGNSLLLGDGKGGFADKSASLPVEADQTSCVVLFDADRDGDLDVFLCNAPGFAKSGQNRLWLNDGSAIFADRTTNLPSRAERTFAAAHGDMNGDGFEDLVVGNFGQPNRLLLGDGKGKFRDATPGLPVHNDRTRALAVGDVDGDGDLDLVVGNAGDQNRLLLGDGKGRFTDVTATSLPSETWMTRALQLADVDADGDLDLVAGNAGILAGGDRNRLLLGNGRGIFVEAAGRIPADRNDTFACLLIDLDDDSDPDIVAANAQRNRVLLNLHHQVLSPFVANAGGPYLIESWYAPGYATGNTIALPLLATRHAATPIHIPNHGVLRIDLATLIPLQAALIQMPGGKSTLPLVIPRVPSLKGVALHTQTVFIPVSAPLTWKLSSLVRDTILF